MAPGFSIPQANSIRGDPIQDFFYKSLPMMLKISPFPERLIPLGFSKRHRLWVT
jgi:hypothetical protein